MRGGNVQAMTYARVLLWFMPLPQFRGATRSSSCDTPSHGEARDIVGLCLSHCEVVNGSKQLRNKLSGRQTAIV